MSPVLISADVRHEYIHKMRNPIALLHIYTYKRTPSSAICLLISHRVPIEHTTRCICVYVSYADGYQPHGMSCHSTDTTSMASHRNVASSMNHTHLNRCPGRQNHMPTGFRLLRRRLVRPSVFARARHLFVPHLNSMRTVSLSLSLCAQRNPMK